MAAFFESVRQSLLYGLLCILCLIPLFLFFVYMRVKTQDGQMRLILKTSSN